MCTQPIDFIKKDLKLLLQVLMAMTVNTADTKYPGISQNLMRYFETCGQMITQRIERDSLNLNCSSNSSCFLSFCSCSRSKRDRGSYSSSGASKGSVNKKILDQQDSK